MSLLLTLLLTLSLFLIRQVGLARHQRRAPLPRIELHAGHHGGHALLVGDGRHARSGGD